VEQLAPGLLVDAEETHQRRVAFEAADAFRREARAVGGERVGELASEGARIGGPNARTGQQGENSRAEDRVEVEYEVEAPAVERPGEMRRLAVEPPHRPAREGRLQRFPRKLDDLVEERLSFQDSSRDRLDQPGDVRTGVGGANRRHRGKGPDDVADSPQADHQNPIGGGWTRKRLERDDDGEPREGERRW
jgi:hypothetical protein